MDIAAVFNSVIALVFVLCLIGLLSLLIRKYSSTRLVSSSGKKKGRISIVDMTVVDGKRRLMIVRRDDTEHLILLGERDLLIESNIKPKARRAGKKK